MIICNLPACPSVELAELNELFDGGLFDGGSFQSLGLTYGRDEDEGLPLNPDNASPLPPSHALLIKDDEVMMDFFDENQAGSTAEAPALQGVRMLPPTADLSAMQVQSLSVKSHALGHMGKTALNLVAPPASQAGVFEPAATTPVRPEPIHSMLKNEPTQAAAPLALAQPEMPPRAVSHQKIVSSPLTTDIGVGEPALACAWRGGFEADLQGTQLDQPTFFHTVSDSLRTAGWLDGAQSYCYGFGTTTWNDQHNRVVKRSRSGTTTTSSRPQICDYTIHNSSRSATLQPVQPHPKALDLTSLTPPAMVWQARKRTKSSTQRIYGLTQVYKCGYCGQRKASTSRNVDDRIRIRCKCGGQHKDGKLRMHATWTLVEDNISHSSDSEQTREQIDEREWMFVDETHTPKHYRQGGQAATPQGRGCTAQAGEGDGNLF